MVFQDTRRNQATTKTVFLAIANAAQTFAGGANSTETLKPQNVVFADPSVSWVAGTGVLTLNLGGIYSIWVQIQGNNWPAGGYALSLLSGSKTYAVDNIVLAGSFSPALSAVAPFLSLPSATALSASLFKGPATSISSVYTGTNDEFLLMLRVVRHG